MGKKDKKKKKHPEEKAPVQSNTPILPRRAWKVVGIGVGIVALGFIVLCFTDPRGQNFASHLSPFLIIGGYTVIGVGIITKEKPSSSS